MAKIEKVYEVEIHEADANTYGCVEFGYRWYEDSVPLSSGAIISIADTVDDLLAELRSQVKFLEEFKASDFKSFEGRKADYD